MRPRRQPDREGRTNVKTLDWVVIFPCIRKNPSKQNKYYRNHDQVGCGVHKGYISCLVDANHFESQRSNCAIYKSLKAPMVFVHSSAEQQFKILKKGRRQHPKINDHGKHRQHGQHYGK